MARQSQTPADAVAPKSGAETARKVLQVLLQFNHRRPTATVRELADLAELSLATTHRYVALLKEMGFLEESGRASYQLGWRVLQLAQAARSTAGLVQLAEPVMQRLSAETEETATLLQLVDRQMECIGQVETDHPLRISLMTGQRLPLTAGASARVLLSQLKEDERRRLLDALARGDADFGSRREDFEREVELVAGQGWASSTEEIDRGIWAVSAPISAAGSTISCVSVAGPISRLTDSTRERVAELTMAAAREIDERFAERMLAPAAG